MNKRGYKTLGECPNCASPMRTLDSRGSTMPNVIRRRRRQCGGCGYKCTTHEIIAFDDEGPVFDQRRVALDFVEAVEKLARETFGDEDGNFLGAGGK